MPLTRYVRNFEKVLYLSYPARVTAIACGFLSPPPHAMDHRLKFLAKVIAKVTAYPNGALTWRNNELPPENHVQRN